MLNRASPIIRSLESAHEVEVSVLGSFADGGRVELATELEQWKIEHPDAGVTIVPPPRIDHDLGDELSLRLMPLPEAADLYRDRAPINRVDDLSCPVLLLQGLDDPVVPPSQSEAFRSSLVRKGIPHAYVAYEGESHGFRRAETIIHSIQAELSFYGQVMGFETPDTPELELWTP